jgi:hypothetical protein
MDSLIYYFSVYSLVVYSLWLLGGLVLFPTKWVNLNSQSTDFFRLVAGVLTATFLSAIFHTHGRSIFWLFLFVLIPVIQAKGIAFNWAFLRSKQIWLPKPRMALFFIPFILQYFFYGPLDAFLPTDIVDYVTFSQYNSLNKVENSLGVVNLLLGKDVAANTPYHYAELWLNQLFYTCFPELNAARLLLHITYPLLMYLLILGLWSLIPTESKWRSTYIFIAFSALFFGSLAGNLTNLFFSGFLAFNKGTIVFENMGFFENTLPSAYHGAKHTYAMVLIVFMFLIRSHPRVLWTMLGLMTGVNIGLFFGVVSAVFFEVLYDICCGNFKKKGIEKAIWVGMPILALSLFYGLNPKGTYSASTAMLYLGDDSLSIKGEISRALHRVILPIIYIILIYLPVILMLIWNRWGLNFKRHILGRLLFFSLIIPLFSRIFLNGFDSAQFLTYLLPLLNIGTLIFVIESNSIKRLGRGVVFVVLGLSAFNAYQVFKVSTQRRELYSSFYSIPYQDAVKEHLLKNKTNAIAYLLNDSSRTANMPGNWSNLKPGSLAAASNHWGIISLNFPWEERNFKSWNNDSPKNHQQFFFKDSLHTARFYLVHLPEFVQQKKINAVFVERGAVDSWVRPLAHTVFFDSHSGEKCYILNQTLN